MTLPASGHYLESPLVPDDHAGLFLYTNFVTSLDGRIAVTPARGGSPVIPDDTANARDWRLFQELAGHADVLITSGRYLRELQAGTAQDILPVSTDNAFADIRRWRTGNGLAPQPAVAVLSESLDFQLPAALREQDREIVICTGRRAPAVRRKTHQANGATVLVLSDNRAVTGDTVCRVLFERGYRSAYCVTGPYVLSTFVDRGCLDALFLTTVHCLVGGDEFTTVLQGDVLSPAVDFRLTSLYYDAAAPDGVGQTFARYDRRRGERPYPS